jgi:hypothetical protein
MLVWLWALASGCDASGSDGDPLDSSALRDAAPTEMASPTRDAGLDASALAPPADAGGALSDGWAMDAALLSDAAPRLSELVQTLFAPGCVLGRCHVTAAPAGELSFTGRQISVHEALVNAASSERPERMRVVPFDADASYLMEKLSSDSPSVGTRMPPMGALPATQIERVRAWIAAGALDD